MPEWLSEHCAPCKVQDLHSCAAFDAGTGWSCGVVTAASLISCCPGAAEETRGVPAASP